MTDQHPITPPPELMQQWREQAPRFRDGGVAREGWLINKAAQWGADQELEACVEWLQDPVLNVNTYKLRADRRPEPQTLNSLALEMLGTIEKMNVVIPEITDTIRRALKQRND